MSIAEKLEADKLIREALQRIKSKSLFSYFYLKQFDYRPDESKVPTIGLNEREAAIVYNPTFVKTLDESQLEGTLMHELSHSILEHFRRKEDRDMLVWNIATDGVINVDLYFKGWALPNGAILNSFYKGKSAEQAYNELVKNQQSKGKGMSQGEQGQGEEGEQDNDPMKGQTIDDHAYSTKAAQEAKEREQKEGQGQQTKNMVDRMVRKAIQESEREIREGTSEPSERYGSDSFGLSGKEPDIIKKYVLGTVSVRFNFKSLLKDEIHTALGENENWMFPHVVSSSVGEYLPSTNNHKKFVVITIDTSGSIADCQAKEFLGIVKQIIGRRKDAIGYIIQCDDAVLSCEPITTSLNIDKLEIRRGNGGTDFRPPFRYLEQRRIKPRIMIYLTDGNGELPEQKPKFPLVWIVSERDKHHADQLTKFGKVIIFPEQRGDEE
jgi:predicted metal-dependent peptidase